MALRQHTTTATTAVCCLVLAMTITMLTPHRRPWTSLSYLLLLIDWDQVGCCTNWRGTGSGKLTPAKHFCKKGQQSKGFKAAAATPPATGKLPSGDASEPSSAAKLDGARSSD